MSDEDRVPVTVPWILLASLAAALVLTGLMRSGPGSEFPPTVAGISVSSVRDALDVQALQAGTDLAARGWLVVEPVPPCAPPPEGAPPAPFLADPCTGVAWLYEHESGTGASLSLVFDTADPGWSAPIGDDGRPIPTSAVLVGHFDDVRADECGPDERQACLDRFVVTAIPWANGAARD